MRRFGSIYTGIGGLELGLEQSGQWECVWQVENRPDCLPVLERHWPSVPRYASPLVVSTSASVDLVVVNIATIRLDALYAARTAITRDEWSMAIRFIRTAKPSLVICLTERATLIRGMDRLLADLSISNYNAEWQTVYGQDIGAPSQFVRLVVLAYPRSETPTWPRLRPPRFHNSQLDAQWITKNNEAYPFPRNSIKLEPHDNNAAETTRVKLVSRACSPLIGQWLSSIL